MDKRTQECINIIYNKIYTDFTNQYIVVFLCGGASNKKYKSMRDKLKKQLDIPRKYRVPIRVFYPEDLVIEVFNRTTNADLLSYESFLANNSDVIVIVCESAGSLVELGAFVNSKFTQEKVIALIDKKHSKDQSFIMLGPIKYLNKLGKNNVLYYFPKDEKKTYSDVAEIITKKTGYHKKSMLPKMKLNTIVGMHFFIQLLLYFYKELSSVKLSEMLKYVIKENKLEVEDFDLLLQSSIKLLLIEKSMIKRIENNISLYSLSSTGYNSIVEMINKCANAYICDKIRVDIMYVDYYKASHS